MKEHKKEFRLVDVGLFNIIAQYLSERPYKEVAPGLTALLACPIISEDMLKEEPKKEEKQK